MPVGVGENGNGSVGVSAGERRRDWCWCVPYLFIKMYTGQCEVFVPDRYSRWYVESAIRCT